MRTLDRSWHDLRVALRPLQTQRVFVWNPGVELATGSMLSCLHWARVLSRPDEATPVPGHAGHAGQAGQAGQAASNDAGAAYAASILTRLDAMIARYHGAPASPATGERFEAATSASDMVIDRGHAQTLAQLEGAVAQLADRLAHPNASMQKRLNWALRTKSV